jgi:hypothetical protein
LPQFAVLREFGLLYREGEAIQSLVDSKGRRIQEDKATELHPGEERDL